MGYSYRFLKPHHPYLPAWTEYRRRRRRYCTLLLINLGAFALGILAVSLGIVLSRQPRESPWVVLAMGVTFLVGLAAIAASTVAFFLGIAAQFQMLSTPCPRCGLAFSWTWYRSGHVTHCLHCGLDEYAPCDPAEQQWEFESQMPKDAG